MRVMNARKTVLELILSDHPKECLTCSSSGQCDLQHLSQVMGIREIHAVENAEMSTYRKDVSPALKRDMDKCIMCRRCETICNDVQTVGALSAVNRGFMSVVAPAFEQDLIDSPCTFCGQCVAVCPTGALTPYDDTAKDAFVPLQTLQKLLLYRQLLLFVLHWVKSSDLSLEHL
jgi:NADP-reducing hydrogenase subunit HndD